MFRLPGASDQVVHSKAAHPEGGCIVEGQQQKADSHDGGEYVDGSVEQEDGKPGGSNLLQALNRGQRHGPGYPLAQLLALEGED